MRRRLTLASFVRALNIGAALWLPPAIGIFGYAGYAGDELTGGSLVLWSGVALGALWATFAAYAAIAAIGRGLVAPPPVRWLVTPALLALGSAPLVVLMTGWAGRP
ncbi:MAG TPA: hypothetical protein VGV61_06800 [Thermoanaerobaculia bacterium]|jgi:hypothetical protein|nr:hypothetical protein [Thermoanaerobaculia bacterium]